MRAEHAKLLDDLRICEYCNRYDDMLVTVGKLVRLERKPEEDLSDEECKLVQSCFQNLVNKKRNSLRNLLELYKMDYLVEPEEEEDEGSDEDKNELVDSFLDAYFGSSIVSRPSEKEKPVFNFTPAEVRKESLLKKNIITIAIEVLDFCNIVLKLLSEIKSRKTGGRVAKEEMLYLELKADYFRYKCEVVITIDILFDNDLNKMNIYKESIKTSRIAKAGSGSVNKNSTIIEDENSDIEFNADIEDRVSKKAEWKRLAESNYRRAFDLSRAELPSTHPLRLSIALNFAYFHFEILGSPKDARLIAQLAYTQSVPYVAEISDEYYADSTRLIHLLGEQFVQ